MTMSDTLFETLSKRVQLEIDDAFDKAVEPNSSRPIKRRKVDTTTMGSGGFLTESLNQPDEYVEKDTIPFELIPTALQALDLPPDDGEILSVFKNASTGWPSSTSSSSTAGAESKYVSRADWRSVCAVLLESRPVPGEIEPQGWADEGNEESDNYLDQTETGSEQEMSNDSSEDEYMDEPKGRRTGRRSALSGRASVAQSQAEESGTLSTRQRQVCVNTFALFFPGATSETLEDQRIMIKDLQRVAKLLNEKLKADEASKI